MTGWRKRQIGEHMTKDEALRLALEALEMYELETNSEFQRKAITAIKEALAHPPQPAPLTGYIKKIQDLILERDKWKDAAQRTWVGLTDDEAEDIWEDYQFNDRPSEVSFANRMNLIQAIEAKLKEKNT
jgi:hypothetical protein